MDNLFAYGTLRDEQVQQKVFARSLEGVPDAVLGYRLGSITINGKVYRALDQSGQESDVVEGMVFELSAAELMLADAYETAAYRRARVKLRSGADAWIYVRA